MRLLTILLAAALNPGGPAAAPNDTLQVTVSGSGETVVFIPGLIGSAYGYRKVIALLDQTRFRTIVIEPLGFGSSAHPANADYSLTAQADRIAAVLDTLVDRQVLIVAHSVSASIAYRLAYRHPRHVNGIVSLEGGITESLATPGFRFAMRFTSVIRTLGPHAIIALIGQQMRRASATEHWITEDVIHEYTLGYQRNLGATLEALRAMSHAEEPERLTDHLAEIQCPVVVLLGATEHRSGPSSDDVAVLRERMPNVTIELVTRAGHFIQEENPGAVAAAIERLVQTTLAGAQ